MGGGGRRGRGGPMQSGANKMAVAGMRTFDRDDEDEPRSAQRNAPPPRRVTGGRGRNLTLPAWMQKDGAGGDDSDQPALQKTSEKSRSPSNRDRDRDRDRSRGGGDDWGKDRDRSRGGGGDDWGKEKESWGKDTWGKESWSKDSWGKKDDSSWGGGGRGGGGGGGRDRSRSRGRNKNKVGADTIERYANLRPGFHRDFDAPVTIEDPTLPQNPNTAGKSMKDVQNNALDFLKKMQKAHTGESGGIGMRALLPDGSARRFDQDTHGDFKGFRDDRWKPGDWYCERCEALCFARNSNCVDCGAPKPADSLADKYADPRNIPAEFGGTARQPRDRPYNDWNVKAPSAAPPTEQNYAAEPAQNYNTAGINTTTAPSQMPLHSRGYEPPKRRDSNDWEEDDVAPVLAGKGGGSAPGRRPQSNGTPFDMTEQYRSGKGSGRGNDNDDGPPDMEKLLQMKGDFLRKGNQKGAMMVTMLMAKGQGKGFGGHKDSPIGNEPKAAREPEVPKFEMDPEQQKVQDDQIRIMTQHGVDKKQIAEFCYKQYQALYEKFCGEQSIDVDDSVLRKYKRDLEREIESGGDASAYEKAKAESDKAKRAAEEAERKRKEEEEKAAADSAKKNQMMQMMMQMQMNKGGAPPGMPAGLPGMGGGAGSMDPAAMQQMMMQQMMMAQMMNKK